MTEHDPNLDGVQDAQEAAQDAAKAQTPPDTHDVPHDAVDGSQDAEDGSQDAEDAETFPRAYVQKLRKEAADHRAKAKDRDDLAERLHLAQVAATGRLADPTDLPYSEGLLDPEKLTEALDELLARKPHLASRRPHGDVGQGATGVSETVDLAGILRSRA